MTIVLWPPNTGDVQPIENGCFADSSPVWPTSLNEHLPQVCGGTFT